MQTFFNDAMRDSEDGREADKILRACVHCGFCLATCPTYQLLGNELDSPRGRIYLIKELLEDNRVTEKTQQHLDRCLSCQACETTCPSGVEYHKLLSIGRRHVDQQVARPFGERYLRQSLARILGQRQIFTPLLKLGQWLRPIMPPPLRALIPVAKAQRPWPPALGKRRMLVLRGCVQAALSPSTNVATAAVVHRLGIDLVQGKDGCCGALNYHLDAQEKALNQARYNIDCWWPEIEKGVEAIVITASGCGNFVKNYPYLLRNDPAYKDKAERVGALSKDISEVLLAEDLSQFAVRTNQKLAFHSPCTLQHGQGLAGVTEDLLQRLGFQLTPVPDAQQCCGSAGTYSILQPKLAKELRDNKLQALQSGLPDTIATANIGCQSHLNAGGETPVEHWIEILNNALETD